MCNKQLGRIGIFLLKEVVLDVFPKGQPESLSPIEISLCLEIYPYVQVGLVRHILCELKDKGRMVGESHDLQIVEQEASERGNSSVPWVFHLVGTISRSLHSSTEIPQYKFLYRQKSFAGIPCYQHFLK